MLQHAGGQRKFIPLGVVRRAEPQVLLWLLLCVWPPVDKGLPLHWAASQQA